MITLDRCLPQCQILNPKA
uniref:Uncharacterized protein n=1 Tax=Rhizophora mucronata TaxID=61149 RepID=A0A2P2NEW6_RHIMU